MSTLRRHRDVVAFALGSGMLGATGREIEAYGLDGLSLLFLLVSLALVYWGGKEALR